MTVTIPTPTITTPRSYYDQGRSRKIAYVIEEGRQVQISVGHDKDRKSFYAVVYEVTVTKSNGFTSEEFSPFDGVRLGSEPVARFSAKALEAYTSKIVAAFPAVVATNEKIQGWFEPTTEEN